MEHLAENQNNLKIDVEILKRDMHQLNGLFSRLDVTIEKLGEVSTNLTKMIAVHENRLEQQENADKKNHDMIQLLFEKVEERRRETESTKEDFRKEITKLHDDILREIKELKHNQNDYYEKSGRRIGALEKWKWMVMGAGVLLGSLAGFLSKLIPSAG